MHYQHRARAAIIRTIGCRESFAFGILIYYSALVLVDVCAAFGLLSLHQHSFDCYWLSVSILTGLFSFSSK